MEETGRQEFKNLRDREKEEDDNNLLILISHCAEFGWDRSECLWADFHPGNTKWDPQFPGRVKPCRLPEQHWGPPDAHHVRCLPDGHAAGLQQPQRDAGVMQSTQPGDGWANFPWQLCFNFMGILCWKETYVAYIINAYLKNFSWNVNDWVASLLVYNCCHLVK